MKRLLLAFGLLTSAVLAEFPIALVLHGGAGAEKITKEHQLPFEATEEAIVNSLFQATTVEGQRRTERALPLEPVLQQLKLSK